MDESKTLVELAPDYLTPLVWMANGDGSGNLKFVCACCSKTIDDKRMGLVLRFVPTEELDTEFNEGNGCVVVCHKRECDAAITSNRTDERFVAWRDLSWAIDNLAGIN